MEVTKLAINDVGISCPTSASKLAEPIPPTPGVSHGRTTVLDPEVSRQHGRRAADGASTNFAEALVFGKIAGHTAVS